MPKVRYTNAFSSEDEELLTIMPASWLPPFNACGRSLRNITRTQQLETFQFPHPCAGPGECARRKWHPTRMVYCRPWGMSWPSLDCVAPSLSAIPATSLSIFAIFPCLTGLVHALERIGKFQDEQKHHPHCQPFTIFQALTECLPCEGFHINLAELGARSAQRDALRVLKLIGVTRTTSVLLPTLDH